MNFILNKLKGFMF